MILAILIILFIACLGLAVFTDWSENLFFRATGLFFAICCWKAFESIMGG